MQTIRIEITKEGQATLSVNGIAGQSCQDISRPFSEALGLTVKDVPTHEAYLTQAQDQVVQA